MSKIRLTCYRSQARDTVSRTPTGLAQIPRMKVDAMRGIPYLGVSGVKHLHLLFKVDFLDLLDKLCLHSGFPIVGLVAATAHPQASEKPFFCSAVPLVDGCTRIEFSAVVHSLVG